LRRGPEVALFLNHARGEESSAGGPGLKLYSAVRIFLEPGGRDQIRFRILKNKAGEPFGEVRLRWRAGQGFTEAP
jgi:hypothetical protein